MRLLLVAVVLAAGCTRSFYRNAADREVYPIIGERMLFPEYDIGRVQVEPAPESRLFDATNPDRPPMPPDDPAAAFMSRPGGMRGAPGWEKDGVLGEIEPAGWEFTLPLDENGIVKLDQDKAFEIALLNSREYQTALETVYLTALGLTLNRFEFDVRWFGRNATTFTHFGSGFPTETNTLDVSSNFGFNRTFAAGGQLLVDFANSFVWEFTGQTREVRSNIAIALLQPLLRNAGRAVRLEGLTQAERDVLYAVRDFARFRKRFWAETSVQAGGYLDLLLALQTLRNNQANRQKQEETYRLYSELFRGGRASVVEVDQFFQSLQAARLSVIDARTNLENAQDNFKLRLGIPPRLPVELDDSLLAQFTFVDPTTEKLRDELEAFQQERLKELGKPPTIAALNANFASLRDFADKVPEALDKATADLKKWGERLGPETLPPPKEGPKTPPLAKGGGDDYPDQQERIRATHDNLTKQVLDIALDLKKITTSIEAHRKDVTEKTRKESWERLTFDVKNLLAQLDTIITLQTTARTYLIELPEVNLAEEEALAFAKENRLDLQNQLAIVTDNWRRVRVAANALKSDLNVIAEASIATEPGNLNPFAFSAEASRYAVGLRFDGPLNRLAERNLYRASLIIYQRARRDYMDLSDRVEFQIRQDLRQLHRLRVAFEISRQQLLSAARQFESERLKLVGPRDKRSASDTTTLNLLQALRGLLDSRNALAASYINYEQQRIQLLLDLEALQMDERGFPYASRLTPFSGRDTTPELPP